MTLELVPLRPAWVEIDLRAIENNTRRLVEIAGDAELMAIVKANAYGHGAVEASRAVLRGGAKWLGVISAGEGIELRRANITAPVFVMGYTPPQWARLAVEHDLTLTVFSFDSARAISNAAQELNRLARVHIKIDTGMSRLGIFPEQALDFARVLLTMPNIEIEGVFTHFSMADTPDAQGVVGWGKNFTLEQLARFGKVVETFDDAGIQVRYRHCANSPAILNLAQSRFNLVRSGILLYGLDPSPEVPRPSGLVPALALKSRVAIVKDVPAGAYVGYGCAFRAARPTRLAVIMIGYADGIRRKLANRGQALVRGQRAPIIGRVCMDQTFIDVTDIKGVECGDEVVLIGPQGTEEIRAEGLAEKQETNNYETLTSISARVERRFL
jgi:alanine racemase